jgi:hypothetical protein
VACCGDSGVVARQRWHLHGSADGDGWLAEAEAATWLNELKWRTEKRKGNVWFPNQARNGSPTPHIFVGGTMSLQFIQSSQIYGAGQSQT